jgi:manganese/zinc/iron transport system substrate-binding protein
VIELLRTRFQCWSLLLAAVAGSDGCSQSPTTAKSANSSASNRLVVVATTGMVADMVRNVTGDQAEVVALMASGVDPHLYKPTTSDVAEIMRADVVFYNGLMLEGPMEPTFVKAAERGKRIVAVAAKLPEGKVRHPKEFEGHPDPHVWMDVALWQECLEPVVAEMSEADPSHASAYRANADRYKAELGKLDEYARRAIGSIPESKRSLVTAHDAFGYFSLAYKIPVRSVQGITTESEPGVEDVNALVSFLVDNHIPALFVETSVSDRNLNAVLEGAKQRGVEVAIGGRLFSDAMGADGTYEGTYIGMIDHNATVIARALGGEAPERGMSGKLSPESAGAK